MNQISILVAAFLGISVYYGYALAAPDNQAPYNAPTQQPSADLPNDIRRYIEFSSQPAGYLYSPEPEYDYHSLMQPGASTGAPAGASAQAPASPEPEYDYHSLMQPGASTRAPTGASAQAPASAPELPAAMPAELPAVPPTQALMPATVATTGGKKLLLVSADHTNPARIKLLTKLASEQGLSLQHIELRKLASDTPLADVVRGFDLVLLDSINKEQTQKNFAAVQPQVGKLDGSIKVMALRWPEGEMLRKNISESRAQAVEPYYNNGGRENFRRMFTYIRAELFGDQQAGAIEPALVYPMRGIYHPEHEQIFQAPTDYLAWYRDQYPVVADAPVIGIFMQQESMASENTAVIDDMIKRIAAAGAIPMTIYFRSDQSISALGDWLTTDGATVIDVAINTRVIHWANKQQQILERLGVTVLHAMSLSRSEQQWRDDNGGIPAMMIPFYLTLPEIAGLVDPQVVATRNHDDGRHYPIDEQMDLLIRKAVRTARLATLPNRDKKVAIFYYNYPPGEKNMGASFLNIPRSIEHISTRMKEEGYRTEAIAEQTMIDAVANLQRPYYREESPATVVEKGFGATLPVAQYRRWYETLPEAVRASIEAHWGQPEDHYMVTEIHGQQQFVIPMFQSGNLMVLPQPPRSQRSDREKSIYHSKTLPINHYYLAVYLYVRENFGADALVHLGTHGSHEWLPGKERGLWAFDPGSLTADGVPVIYPYIVDDVGEALQAKRRGHAVMISHMTPPFAPSGLYREMSEIHELMHQYDTVDPGLVKKRTRKRLLEKLESMKIPQDMGWEIADVKARFADFLAELHDYMHALASENQPLGLHTWGRLAENRLLATTIMQILGNEYAEAVADYLGERDVKDDQHGHRHTQSGSAPLMGDQVKLENIPGFELIHRVIIEGAVIPKDVSGPLKALLLRGRELFTQIRGIMEMESFFKALKGQFVMPSTGGDPIRNEESLPTGRNLYGFDPSRLPTPAAYESGKQLVQDLIADYFAKHGKYPEKMAFSLWSIEAMRHYGVLESQAMYAMGLKPVWAESGRVTGTEIIPYSELGRPRIDVVLSATGLYRDAFPNVMHMLAEGVEKIAKLKEQGNYVRRNARRLRQELIEAGVAPKDAEYLSTVRIFSRTTGSYGTGLGAATLASDTWEQDSRLAKLYMDRMGAAFGSDPRRWNERIEGVNLYAKNLSGTDVALFSRSSNLYGLLTSDDPFQYLGGISLAVRNLDGKSPEMFITNLRNPKQEKMETLNTFMSKELRTRYLHPRWIEEMQQEGYSGTLSIVNTINNFWGWQVMDPQNIRADQWQELFEVYVNDKYDLQMKAWFETNNAEALAQISERMLEAIRKEYWQPDEATIKKLLETYQEISVKYDVQTINQKFKDFVAEQAKGYGLSPPSLTPMQPSAVPPPQPAAAAPDEPQPVTGQKLEKTEVASEIMNDQTRYVLLLLLMLTLLAGAVWQQWRRELSDRFNLVMGR